MQQELALKVIMQGTLGIILLTLLLVLFLALRNDIKKRKPLSAVVIFALVMLGLWCFAAFAEVYVSLDKMIAPYRISW